MLPLRLVEAVGSLARRAVERSRLAASVFPGLARRPALLGRWLATAWPGWIALALTVSFLLFALRPLLDAALPIFYPDVVEKRKVLGVLPHTHREEHPLREARRRQATVLAWAGGCGLVLFAFWLHVPAAVAGGRRRRGAKGGVGDRYELVEELGRGGMGRIWRGVDRVLDRRVAVKELPLHGTGDGEAVRRFRAEARSLARLAHPHVVQVYDLVEDAGRLWMVMELIEGGDLAGRIREDGAIAAREASRLIAPVADALHFAHGHDIVHRDVKPANVLLTVEGTPKLADFGVARLASSATTVTGAVIGSPRYMSPEQAGGGVADARSDIYSLGVTLYEMLTGSTPFEGDPLSVLARHVNEAPPRPAERGVEIPGEMERLVMEMLAKDPKRRPRDMAEVAERLARCGQAP